MTPAALVDMAMAIAHVIAPVIAHIIAHSIARFDNGAGHQAAPAAQPPHNIGFLTA